MNVKILKKNKRIKGDVGAVVECPAEIGNPLACLGVVSIVEHDKPSELQQMQAMVVKGDNAKRALREAEGGDDE